MANGLGIGDVIMIDATITKGSMVAPRLALRASFRPLETAT